MKRLKSCLIVSALFIAMFVGGATAQARMLSIQPAVTAVQSEAGVHPNSWCVSNPVFCL
jgi:hypothetical protein